MNSDIVAAPEVRFVPKADINNISFNNQLILFLLRAINTCSNCGHYPPLVYLLVMRYLL